MSQGDADAFRRWGHLQADLDPLGRLRPVPHPELDAPPDSPWRRFYSGTLAAQFMHLAEPERAAWIADRMEHPEEPGDPRPILELLLRADLFERALQSRYPGTKRYSLEGLTALLPLLEEVLHGASRHGAAEVLIGMSHRGRLNVMVHVVGRPAREVFGGFEDVDPRSVLGGGDVKYHLGANGERVLRDGRNVRVAVASNPSHLEAVDPVVLGRARARQDRHGGPSSVVPVLLHGDAAFAGQGIAAETLNLAGLDGYSTGGAIHVVLNNLIGFTTPPERLHSSRYATDVALRASIPILHVNGEDPAAAVRAASLAADYRARFGGDIVIDLIGYRRHGHSEVEDPTTTQPALYRAIAERPPLWKRHAEASGLPTEELEKRVKEDLARELEGARQLTRNPVLRELPPWWSGFSGGRYDPAFEVETAVPRERLVEIADRLAKAPEGFGIHPKVERLLRDRQAMARGERPVDWACAEALALGSLLAEGVRVRLSGQDARRGTFNQRHAALVDVRSEAEFLPAAALGGPFEAIDSPLSEAAPLGFEYGYSRDFPEALVVWEAQFGDFANGAQGIIDQFVAAGEDKWGLLSGLVLLLPHGYEGQGPEHSSARPERFLQLAAEDNLEIVQPTTAAQYFHLLRRQALRRWRKPLVVFTPKSYLRRPESSSAVDRLARGAFEPVLGDSVKGATGVLVGTGKIVHELRAERAKRGRAVAIVSLEKLYPFPEAELAAELDRHGSAREIVWVQEEPANMGAWTAVQPVLERLAGGRTVRSVKRSASASPSTGSAKAHALEQAALLGFAMADLGARETRDSA